MASNVSSPRKATKKASTQARSTTSSTIKTAPSEADETVSRKKRAASKIPELKIETKPVEVPTLEEPSSERQKVPEIDSSQVEVPTHILAEHQVELLRTLAQGLSPMAFCKKFHYPIQAYHRTRSEQAEFDLAVRQAQHSLSDNVASRLYLEAMEGNVSAMTSWLKLRPPQDWQLDEPQINDHTSWENMSDAELVDLARLRGVEIPSELEAIVD